MWEEPPARTISLLVGMRMASPPRRGGYTVHVSYQRSKPTKAEE